MRLVIFPQMSARQATALRIYNKAVEAGKVAQLPAWAMTLAEWRAEQDELGNKRIGFPWVWQEVVKIVAPLGITLEETQVRKMYKSTPFRKYWELCYADAAEAARYKLIAQSRKAVDLHYDAMDWAREQKAVGHVAGLTEAILARIMPKRQEAPPVQTNIQINLTAKQASLIDSGEAIMESEAVVVEATSE